MQGAQCRHAAAEHQPILGQAWAAGRLQGRPLCAGVWSARPARHILAATRSALAAEDGREPGAPLKLQAGAAAGVLWAL
eukprot:8019732-Lingulodinium_polyedra.AAC.1